MTSTENRPRGFTPAKPTSSENHERHLEHVKSKFEKALQDAALESHFESAEDLIKAALKLEDSSKRLHPRFVKRLTELWKPVLKDQLRKEVGDKLSKEQQADVDKRAKEAATEFVAKQARAIQDSLSGETLIERCREVLAGCQIIAAEIPTRISLIDRVIEQIELIQSYEFVRGIVGAGHLKFNGDISALTRVAGKLKRAQEPLNQLITDLRSATNGAKPGDGKDEARRKLLVRQLDMGDEYFPTVESLSYKVEKALDSLTVEVKDTAASAYVLATDPVVEDIEGAKKVCDLGIGLTGSLLQKTNASGVFIRLASLFSSIGATAAVKVQVHAKMKELNLTTTMNDVFEGYDRDPTLLAKQLQANQLAALEILLNGLSVTLSGSLIMSPGVAEAVMTLWDGVVAGVTMAVREILAERMDKAVKKLEAEGLTILPVGGRERESFWGRCKKAYDETYTGVESAITAAITKHISAPSEELLAGVRKIVDEADDTTTITDILGTSFDPGQVGGDLAGVKFNPLQLEAMLLRIFLPPVVRRVVKFLDVPPAEVLTGGQLIALQQGIETAKVPIGTVFGSVVERDAPRPLPVTDLPATVNGRGVLRSNANRSKLDGGTRTYYLSLDFDGIEVWGRYDTALKTWTAVEVDPASFTEWDEYRISIKYVKDGRKIKTPGRWLKVSIPEYGWTHYAFEPEDNGRYLWGHMMDTPYGPSGHRFELAAQVGTAAMTTIAAVYAV